MIGGAFHNCLGEWYKGKRSDMSAHRAGVQVEAQYEALRGEADVYDQEEYDKFAAVRNLPGDGEGVRERYTNDRAEWDIYRPGIEAQFNVNMGEFDYAGKVDLVTDSISRVRGMYC
jgi:lipocalin